MAAPGNALLTTGGSAVVGMREDLADYIAMISPEEVPFFTFCGNATAKNDLAHDWQTVSLRAGAQNAQPEGNIFAATAPKRSTRLTNVCQNMHEVASVSGTTEAVVRAGRESEIDWQVMLKSLELRRDVEWALLANVVKDQTDPRKLAGIVTWAGTAKVGATGTAPTGNGATAVVEGTAYALDIDDLNVVMRDAWIKGARTSFMMMHPTQKLIFDQLPVGTNLAEAQATVGNAGGVEYVTTVAIWKSAFGPVKAIVNQWMDDSMILGFDERDQYKPKKAPLPGRAFKRDKPQFNFDGKAEAIIWEGTLEVPAPDSIWLMAGLINTLA